MDELFAKLKANPPKDGPPLDIPDYFWKASAKSMEILLNTLKKEYGSVEGYLREMGMPEDLSKKLKKALLV